MITTNKIRCNIDREKISKSFSFFKITGSKDRGAYLLDKIKDFYVMSVVFDRNTIYLCFKNNRGITVPILKEGLDNEQDIIIEQISDLSTLTDQLILRLFLYSLNYTDEDCAYNNITGKLYLIDKNFISNNRDKILAINIDIDYFLQLTINITTFTKVKNFNFRDFQKLPKYILGEDAKSLIRTIDYKDKTNIYVKKAFTNKKLKTIPFLNFYENINKCRNYYLIATFHRLKEIIKEFATIELITVEANRSISKLDKDYLSKSIELLKNKGVVLVDKLGNQNENNVFSGIVEQFEKVLNMKISTNKNISKNKVNFVLTHNKSYFEDNGIVDKYIVDKDQRNIQHFTLEDSLSKIKEENKAIIATLIKEAAIKSDILNKKVCIDDWNKLKCQNNYIFGKIIREKDKPEYVHLLLITKEGSMKFFSRTFDEPLFSNEILNKCDDMLRKERIGSDIYLVADDLGNINIIKKTELIPVASESVYKNLIDENGRLSRHSKDFSCYEGLRSLNFINLNGAFYYNAGVIGSFNTSIANASHFYRVYNAIGVNIIEKIFESMAVSFVKLNSFTILPYPFKYLNEWIRMNFLMIKK